MGTHISDDEAVAKMGHPGFACQSEGDLNGALFAVEIRAVAGVGPVSASIVRLRITGLRCR